MSLQQLQVVVTLSLFCHIQRAVTFFSILEPKTLNTIFLAVNVYILLFEINETKEKLENPLA